MNKILVLIATMLLLHMDINALSTGLGLLNQPSNVSNSSQVMHETNVEEDRRQQNEQENLSTAESREIQGQDEVERKLSTSISTVSDSLNGYFVGLWQNVSPVVRCPIEFCVNGFRYIYARNKIGAVAALIGAGSAVTFAVWTEYRCWSMYDSPFCNPFRDPSLTDKLAYFFGL